MAGGAGHGSFRVRDPAIERFDRWRETYYLRFRWTPKNFRIFATYCIIFPASLYAIASYSEQRWDWKGARKGQALDTKSKPTALEES